MNYYRRRTQLWYHNRHVSAFVEMDKLCLFDSKAQDIEKILHDATDITSIHRHIKSLKRFSKASSNKVLRVNRSDGRPSTSKIEEKHTFRSHFSSQLGGTFGTFAGAHLASLETLNDL